MKWLSWYPIDKYNSVSVGIVAHSPAHRYCCALSLTSKSILKCENLFTPSEIAANEHLESNFSANYIDDKYFSWFAFFEAIISKL